MARLALKFGYNGTPFYGFQRQPGVRTVEGEIISACEEMHAFSSVEEADFASSSRTDRGVHAIGNVVAFNTDYDPVKLIHGLNALCSDILFHSYLEVNASFNPRRARMRHYRYMLSDAPDSGAVAAALKHFTGERDFKNFSKSGGKGRYRKIERIETAPAGDTLLIDFYGKSFLHNMIRRVVAASVSVALGSAREDDIVAALGGGTSRSFGLAPPQYLILVDVDYGIGFRRVRLREETEKRWRAELGSLRALEFVETELIRAVRC